MKCVLDASATMAWTFLDETTPTVLQVLREVEKGGALVPTLWPLEVANVLQISVKKGRCTPEYRDRALSSLRSLPIVYDNETSRFAWTTVLVLAERHELTVYDAAYLELALRRQLPLATLDKKLRQAATVEGVPLLGI